MMDPRNRVSERDQRRETEDALRIELFPTRMDGSLILETEERLKISEVLEDLLEELEEHTKRRLEHDGKIINLMSQNNQLKEQNMFFLQRLIDQLQTQS